jgi:hypothetical protein
MKMYLKFQLQQTEEFVSLGHIGTKDTRRGLWTLPLQLRKATEARHVLGVSLHGGPERPLCGAVKMKPELLWRPREVGDARAMGELCQRELQTGFATSPRGRNLVSQQSEKEVEI